MAGGRQSPARLIDVAERAGVSLTTASFAMSGRPGVSEAVAQKVRAIAAELGYVPNMQARSLASGASTMLGLVVHDIADPYFGELASSVVETADRLGLMVQICQSSRDPANELTQVRTLVASRVRGIIMAGSGTLNGGSDATYEELARFQSTGGKVAMIGRHRAPLDAVVPGNRAGGRAIGEHVATLGHRTVGIAAGPEGLASAQDRLAGVTEALRAQETPVNVIIEHSAFTHAGGASATEALLRRRPDLTAIVALNDSMAAGVIKALRNAGRSIPGEVTVTGFDDVQVAGDLGPGLTTYRLPLREMGAAAVELALKEPTTRPRRRQVTGELIVRRSSAPPAD